MSAEMAQQGLPSTTTDYVINARLEQIEGALEEPDAQDRSIVILATLVGALVLSRGAQSDALREKILAVTRNALKQSDQQA